MSLALLDSDDDDDDDDQTLHTEKNSSDSFVSVSEVWSAYTMYVTTCY